MGIFHEILLAPQNIGMNLNNVLCMRGKLILKFIKVYFGNEVNGTNWRPYSDFHHSWLIV